MTNLTATMPDQEHKDLRFKLVELLNRYGDMSIITKIALLANIIGNGATVVESDSSVTREMIIEIMMKNFEQGIIDSKRSLQ